MDGWRASIRVINKAARTALKYVAAAIALPIIILFVVWILGKSGVLEYLAQFQTPNIDMTINGHEFRIPRDYIPRNSDRSGGKRDGVILVAFYPDFLPSTKKHNPLYGALGHSNRVTIQIHSIPFSGSGLFEKLNDYIKGREGEIVEGGRRFELDETFELYSEYASIHELYLISTTTKSVLVHCLKEGHRKSPGCVGYFTLFDDVGVTFLFSRKYLLESGKIEQKASKLSSLIAVVNQDKGSVQ